MLLLTTTIAALVPLTAAIPTTAPNSRSNNEIEWSKCKFGLPPAVLSGECGTMMVPLDYTDDDSEETEIEIVRVAASKKPKKGSVFLNFGGPGASGLEDLAGAAINIQAATGGHYDLVNVVPRGTNNTLPFSCYTNEASRGVAAGDLIAGKASDVALGEVWAQAKLVADNCAALQNETGRFIGTAFTARDHMRVVDAIEDDGMLRFWGFSYGTLLGETMLAMFPEKVDRMILDGVVNPFQYYQNSETDLMTSTDDVFKGFCKGCVEAPKACALAGNRTAEQLEDYLYDLLEDLKTNPVPVVDPLTAGGGTLVDYTFAKAILLRELNFPYKWPAVAKMVADVAAGDGSTIVGGDAAAAGLAAAKPKADKSFTEAKDGIKCSDVLVHAEKLEDIMPTIEKRHELSRFGGDAADQVLAQCARWKLPAKERYDGDFNEVKTKNPVLLINNRYDPVTPLVSAKNVSETLEGSVLLEQNSYGHISLTQGSYCTAKAVRAYFNDGKLPEKGTVCDDVTAELFSGLSGWGDVRKWLEGNSTSTSS